MAKPKVYGYAPPSQVTLTGTERALPPRRKDEVRLSTWPFRDGFPWDEELVRGGVRALTTHGPQGGIVRA